SSNVSWLSLEGPIRQNSGGSDVGYLSLEKLSCQNSCKRSWCPDKDNCVYYLRGVVEHMGTMRSGHYVAYVRCCEDENYQDAGRDGQPEKSLWYYASDSHVRRISFSEVLQSEAYLLFYEKHTLC
ncbi:hypothetical protein SUGI_0204330, partial [Cryptomeria japonica]